MNQSTSPESLHFISYPLSENDNFSDSDWLEIASNRESDTESVSSNNGAASSSHSRRSSISTGSSRSGDVEAWEGFLEEITDEVEAKINEFNPTNPDNEQSTSPFIDLDEDHLEERRVRDGLNQSLTSTLGTSRISSHPSTVHNSLRDLRLSFPDPLSSSHDEMNRSYDRVSSSEAASATLTEGGENDELGSSQVDMPEITLIRDPGLPPTPEAPGQNALQSIQIHSTVRSSNLQVVLYGTSFKWSFVDELLRKAIVGGEIAGIDGSETEQLRPAIFDCMDLPRSDYNPDRPSLGIVFHPLADATIAEHTAYLPVVVGNNDDSFEKEFQEAQVAWASYHIPPHRVVRLEGSSSSSMFAAEDVDKLDPYNTHQAIQRIIRQEKPASWVGLFEQFNTVHAVTLFALLAEEQHAGPVTPLEASLMKSSKEVMIRPSTSISAQASDISSFLDPVTSTSAPQRPPSAVATRLVDSLSEIVVTSMKALIEVVEHDLKDLMVAIDDLMLALHRSTSIVVEQSKSAAQSVWEQLDYRNARAKDRARELKDKGMQLMSYAGNHILGRTTDAKQTANFFKDLITSRRRQLKDKLKHGAQRARHRARHHKSGIKSHPTAPSIPTSVVPTSPNSSTPSSSTNSTSPTPSRTPFNYSEGPVRGVNLGGWFVLEPWITPSIFEATNDETVVDEYTLGMKTKNYNETLAMLQNHWNTWITEDDFIAINEAGLNHVRIPLGYWSVPLPSSATNTSTSISPYIPGAWPYLLRALNWAAAHNVHVILDLHGAPGSQNGYDNSGQRTSDPQWALNTQNVTRSIDTLVYIAQQIGGMIDILELVNESAGFLSSEWASVTRSFFSNGYTAVRNAVGDTLNIMIGDAFLGVDAWDGFLTYPSGVNALMDNHEYQIFSIPELQRSFSDHLAFTCTIRSTISSFAAANIWTIEGEWSTAPTDCALWLNGRGVGARWDNSYNGGASNDTGRLKLTLEKVLKAGCIGRGRRKVRTSGVIKRA
ncbi:hypothetical protein HHX47_DHR7000093 [Lentinula edodes]|nr:hypothetical protein HHX47_DHR7000093 [Lentinula edodes]